MFDAAQRKVLPIGRAVIACFVVLVVIGYARCGVPWGGRDVSPGVTAARVRGIKLGMDEAAVLAELGPPFERELLPDGRVELRYTRPVMRVERYPTLAVMLRDGRVHMVFSEMVFFWGVDEYFLYSLSDEVNGEAREFAEVFQ